MSMSDENGHGGSGGVVPGPEEGKRPRTRKGLRLYCRAISKGWPVSPEIQAEIVKAMAEMIENPRSGKRERIYASKVLMLAFGQNLTIEKLRMERERLDKGDMTDAEMEALARELLDARNGVPNGGAAGSADRQG